MFYRTLVAASILSVLSSSCTIVESTGDFKTLGYADDGPVYYIPRTFVELYIRTDAIAALEKDPNAVPWTFNSQLLWSTITPTNVPDPQQEYLLRYKDNP